MQLFVLGPAFDLPSIDAECNAAIAWLQSQQRSDWELISTGDDSTKLPLLVDGDHRVSGFSKIVRYLQSPQSSSTARSEQHADSTALTSFLESNAQTLLDISLYVSYENYRHTTRPAFTKILPWHINYILPPRLRSAARARTEHLGISSIDVDNVHEDMSNRPEGFDGVGKEKSFEPETQKRASLLLPRRDTIRSLLQRPEHAATFKLHTLADNFFELLRDQLGDKNYLLGEELNTIDCLAFGYLSLMLYPKVPQDWLASTMRRKYKTLVAYAERMRKTLDMSDSTLPRAAATRPSAVDTVKTISEALVALIPLFAQDAKVVPKRFQSPPVWRQYMLTIVGVLAASLGVGLYSAFHTGQLNWPHGEQIQIFGRKRMADYGHLGAALAGLSVLGQQAAADARFHESQDLNISNRIDVAVVEDDAVP